MKKGDYYFNTKQYRKSFANYIIAGFTGDYQGLLNAGILADSFKIITDSDINYYNIQEELDNDWLYNKLKKDKLLPFTNIWNFLYDDILQILINTEKYSIIK